MEPQFTQEEDNLTEASGEPVATPLESSTEDGVMISKTKIALAKKLFSNLKENIDQLNNLLAPLLSAEEEAKIGLTQITEGLSKLARADESAEKVVEGIFDGEAMIGPDGKRYNVSANYASKSKLVEGDILKLVITSSGTFLFKQIGPIERVRLVGTLKQVNENDFIVVKDDKSWHVLNASVTYFKGEDGDEAVILLPKNSDSRWGAVENVIKKS